MVRNRRDAVGRRRDGGGLLDRAPAKDRQAWFRIASNEVDREGTIIEPGGIDLTYHRQNPVFLWQHQSGTDEIGKAPEPDVVIGHVVDYDQTAAHLDILVEFDDDGPQGLASRCWQKVQKGLIRMTSLQVGLGAPEVRLVSGTQVQVYAHSELWECSLVIIGSVRSALKLERRARTSTAKRGLRMDKAALCKAIGAEEGATREEASEKLLDHLTTTDHDTDARKAVRAAFDEHFPAVEKDDEEDPADPSDAKEDKDKEAQGGATKTAKKGEGEDKPEDLKGALDEMKKALREAQDELAKRDVDPKNLEQNAAIHLKTGNVNDEGGRKKSEAEIAEKAAKREAQLHDDVDGWIAEGRIKSTDKKTWLERHRTGAAAGIVKHLEKGIHRRLSGGQVGTQVEVPPPAVAQEDKDAQDAMARAEHNARNASRGGR
jgi:hypothetical protein